MSEGHAHSYPRGSRRMDPLVASAVAIGIGLALLGFLLERRRRGRDAR